MVEPKPKPPGYVFGRPTEYDPALCEKVIEWGRSGKSRTWIAAQIGVTRECIYEWMRTHRDFSDAMALAKVLEQQWWEDAGQNGLLIQGFAQSVWSRSMGARFPDEWRETSRRENTGPDGSPMEVKHSGAIGELIGRISRINARIAEDGDPSASDGT